jgi:inhibitor of KinA sporulation pathway (predicted exonuclease)
MELSETNHKSALYLDLECTFWEEPPPLGMKREIIEIGVVEMDLQSLTIVREAVYFVRPRRWDISQACTKLTGITAEDIQSALPFGDVLNALTAEFSPATKLCCTWGDDAEVIAHTCHSHGQKSPFRHIFDVGYFFQRAFLLKQQSSLGGALEMLGLDPEGIPHGALVDARNTARIHAALARRMRREPGPPARSVCEPRKTEPGGIFAEKLRQCLEIQPKGHTASES